MSTEILGGFVGWDKDGRDGKDSIDRTEGSDGKRSIDGGDAEKGGAMGRLWTAARLFGSASRSCYRCGSREGRG